MTKTGVTQAFKLGADAYLIGLDILNIPGYLSDLERENWVAGYESAMYNSSIVMDDGEVDYSIYDKRSDGTDNDYIGLNGDSMSYSDDEED